MDSHDIKCFPENVPDSTINKIDENNENRRNKNNSQYYEIRGSGKKNKCAKPAGDAVTEMDSTLDVDSTEGISGSVLPSKCKFAAGLNQSNTSLQKAHALDWLSLGVTLAGLDQI